MLIILGIIFLLSLVIIHEIGHFIAARRAGIEVEEFGLGFPPRVAILTEKNGTKYTLNALPLGGFVKLKGEHDSDLEPGAFGAATIGQKIQVMVAGVVMNILVAVFLLTIISAVSMPKVLPNQFSIARDTKVVRHDIVLAVAEESPAAQATPFTGEEVHDHGAHDGPGDESFSEVDAVGLKDGDKLLMIRAHDCESLGEITTDEIFADKEKYAENECVHIIKDAASVKPATQALAARDDRHVVITVDRKGEQLDFHTELLSAAEVKNSVDDNAACIETGGSNCPSIKGHLGIIPSDYVRQRSTWSAPIAGVALTGQFFWETLRGLGGIITNLFNGHASQAGEQVTGVVGIGYVLKELSSQGFISVLFLTAVISISLAVMNILPIPALDGGRLFVTLISRALLKRPLSRRAEEQIHGTGFALLMILFVLITILDVKRFIL